MVSVLAVHTLPLQTLFGSSESVQLDGAALELTPILCNLLLGPAKGILVKPGSVRQMLHTHCRNDKRKDGCVLEIRFTVPHHLQACGSLCRPFTHEQGISSLSLLSYLSPGTLDLSSVHKAQRDWD